MMNTIGDSLKKDIFKVIISRNPFHMEDQDIEMIIIMNIQGTDVSRMHYVSTKIWNLIHSTQLNITFDPAQDYQNISSILFGD